MAFPGSGSDFILFFLLRVFPPPGLISSFQHFVDDICSFFPLDLVDFMSFPLCGLLKGAKVMNLFSSLSPMLVF